MVDHGQKSAGDWPIAIAGQQPLLESHYDSYFTSLIEPSVADLACSIDMMVGIAIPLWRWIRMGRVGDEEYCCDGLQ
jgi:hypothetical protein